MKREGMAAIMAAGLAGGAAEAAKPSLQDFEEVQQMQEKLIETKENKWLNTLLEQKGPLNDAEAMLVKEKAHVLADADELPMLIENLNKLIDAGKMKQGEAVSMFIDVTKDMDPETLSVKVSGVGTEKSDLSEAIAGAIDTSHPDNRYLATPAAGKHTGPKVAGVHMEDAVAKKTPKK